MFSRNINKNCVAGPTGRNNPVQLCKRCCLLLLQVLYRTSSQTNMNVLNTEKTTAEILLQLNDDYIIEVRATTDGGDGTSSDQILIPRLASMLKLESLLFCHVLMSSNIRTCFIPATVQRDCLCLSVVKHY